MGVASSWSLFLPFSSLRGVCNAGISGVLVWAGGIFPWLFCFDDVGLFVISCCSECNTSLPLDVLAGGVRSLAGCCEVVADDVPTPMC